MPPTRPRIIVIGPAYLDRVLRVDRRLADPPLDFSLDGRLESSPDDDARPASIRLVDPNDVALDIQPPPRWPGPRGLIRLSRPLAPEGVQLRATSAVGIDWSDDLGGMGAGYAAALGGELVTVLGVESDQTSARIERLLDKAGVRIASAARIRPAADWTLVVSSGPHGDKLPVGFRGPAAVALDANFPAYAECDLRVVASGTNALASQALAEPGAAVRVFAPSLRNMLDVDPPVAALADHFDILACNRREWTTLPESDRAHLESKLQLLSITDGEAGAEVACRDQAGGLRRVRVPAFPRDQPPVDTNRAGEAFAATLIKTLLSRGPLSLISTDDVAAAAHRGSAAAALVLDIAHFGFPTDAAVDAALARGRVAAVEP